MPGNKYLALDPSTGRTKEVVSSQTSAGAGDAGKIPALSANGKLDPSMMPPGVGEEARTVVASETLAAGDLVNLWNDAGTIKVRKADATTNGKRAHGFVESAVTSGASATVFYVGINGSVTGLTVGSDYFLGTTPGAVTTAPPSATGNLVQRVGTAMSATELAFMPEEIATVA